MLFILNQDLQIVDVLSMKNVITKGNTVYFEDYYTQMLATGAETFEFKTIANSKESENLIVGNYIAFREDNQDKLFNIIETTETKSEEGFIKYVYCEMHGIELKNAIIRPMKVLNASPEKFAMQILEDTDWQVGHVDDIGTLLDINIEEHMTVYDAIQKYIVEEYGMEIFYTVDIQGNSVINKYLNIVETRGLDRGLRFTYNNNIQNIERTIDVTDICTALIGVGNNGLTFKSVQATDKPLNQDYIESETAYRQWSVNGYHIFGYEKFDTDSPQELLKLTRKKLEERCNPKVKYSLGAELLDEDAGIGDYVRITDMDFEPPITLSARISTLVRSKTDVNGNSCEISNFKELQSNITQQMRNLASTLKGYADGINIDNINKGGFLTSKIETVDDNTLKINNKVERNEDYCFEFKHLTAEPVLANFQFPTGAVMQQSMIDYHEKKMYIVYDATGNGDMVIHQTDMNGIILGKMTLNKFGHGNSMGIERRGSKTYIWSECDGKQASASDPNKLRGTKICYFEFKDGVTATSTYGTVIDILPNWKALSLAVDDTYNKLAIRGLDKIGGTYYYHVYDLKSVINKTPKLLKKFKEVGNVGTSAMQGFDILGRYIYKIQGAGYYTHPPKLDSYVTCIDTETGKIRYTQLIDILPDMTYREIEGIKVVKRSDTKYELQFGMVSEHKSPRKNHIFKYTEVLADEKDALGKFIHPNGKTTLIKEGLIKVDGTKKRNYLMHVVDGERFNFEEGYSNQIIVANYENNTWYCAGEVFEPMANDCIIGNIDKKTSGEFKLTIYAENSASVGGTISGSSDAITYENGKLVVNAGGLVGVLPSDLIEVEGIKSNHLQANSITADKIKANSITTDHLQANSITTDHLQANTITADKIKANEITTDHLQANSITADKLTTGELITQSAQIKDAVIDSVHINKGVIESVHIKEGAIDSVHINDGSITTAKIGDAQIGTAQIKDAEITVAKIQDAFINDLVAVQGKFQSAHIGTLTSDNIDAKTIKAEHIKASVIDAINLNVGGKISADKIDASNIKVDKIDAGAIVSGTIDADRINGSVINAINASIENAVINSAKIGEIDASKITSGTISTDILKSNVISAINASIGKINAEHIDVSSIKVDKIDAGAIISGTIDAERIKGSVVQAINLSAQKIDAKNINVNGLQVGGANIVEGSIVSAHIEKGQITNAHINSAFIADGYIKDLDAGKITTGTLDAGKVNIRNLKADNIVAGSITVQGDNLIKNTRWKTTDGWYVAPKYAINPILQFENENVITFNQTGATSVANNYLYNKESMIPATAGEQYVGTIYLHTDNLTGIDGDIQVGIWYYDASGGGKGNTIKTVTLANNVWQRVQINGVVPDGAKKIALVVNIKKNGKINISKPMISKGTIASIWKPHTDELISDGAIDNDKIANDTITADKLVIDSLWADEGFISNFQSTSIDAGQITTGKITGEYLDIEGFIKFSDLDNELADNFVRPVDSNGNILGTYINGATIHTGTLHGDQIIANGFTAKDQLNNTTFNIDKDTGEVTMSGEVKSMNYSDIVGNEEGYRLTPNGNAYLNDATIRGSLIAPDAGITNYGGRGRTNLIKRTDFDFTTIEEVKEYWGFSTSSNVTHKIIQYAGGVHEEQNSPIKGRRVLRQAIDLTTTTTQGYLNPLGEGKKEYITLEPNATYTFSVWLFKGGSCNTIGLTLWAYNDDGSNRVSIKSTSISEYKGKFEKLVFTFKTDSRKNYQIRLYNNAKTGLGTGESIIYVYQPKLELGDNATEYNSNIDDNIKYVRFWAGGAYEDRESAPFIVYSDGSIKATQGDFGGVFSGKVSIGNIHIEDTNSTNGFIDIKTNDDAETKIHLEENSSYIRSELEIGDDFVNFNTDDKQLNINGVTTYTNSKTTSKMNYGNNILETTDSSGGHHIQRYSTGRYIFENKSKSNTYDFAFYNADHNTRVDVYGEMYIKNKITMNNNIAIVARQDTGNSGFDYVVK